MAIEINAVRPGKCYTTKHAEVRKVVNVKNGIVIYDSRAPRPGLWITRPSKTIEIFTREVVSERECEQ